MNILVSAFFINPISMFFILRTCVRDLDRQEISTFAFTFPDFSGLSYPYLSRFSTFSELNVENFENTFWIAFSLSRFPTVEYSALGNLFVICHVFRKTATMKSGFL